MFEYKGALHIHSLYSDGSGTPDEIARFADEVELDFIILTDHNTLRALKEGYEKWYGNTLLLIGCELNDKENKNHYLAFGIDETYSTRMSAQSYVKKVKEAGGIGFLAHPHEKRDNMAEHPPYPWTEWGTEDFTGIEIWNHMSEWMENLTEQNKYQAFLHPLKTVTAPQEVTLKLWDELNLKRKVVGIGGVDAHAHKYNLLGFFEVEIFPYKVLFKSIRTHILLDKELEKNKNIDKAKKEIYLALKDGRSFFANDYLADSTGFLFYAEQDKVYHMGSTIKPKRKTSLKTILPKGVIAEIRLIRNGKLIDMIEENEAEFIVDLAGVYRIEVYLNGKAWIYSNHIRMF
ncbi:MAG TPA: CehA/McbA family metallohydrolase [Ignavibacteriaceae bacterium]|nr:CehA/McbA family metallohydrolase [Ignavibacteriaceae bacterium]